MTLEQALVYINDIAYEVEGRFNCSELRALREARAVVQAEIDRVRDTYGRAKFDARQAFDVVSGPAQPFPSPAPSQPGPRVSERSQRIVDTVRGLTPRLAGFDRAHDDTPRGLSEDEGL